MTLSSEQSAAQKRLVATTRKLIEQTTADSPFLRLKVTKNQATGELQIENTETGDQILIPRTVVDEFAVDVGIDSYDMAVLNDGGTRQPQEDWAERMWAIAQEYEG